MHLFLNVEDIDQNQFTIHFGATKLPLAVFVKLNLLITVDVDCIKHFLNLNTILMHDMMKADNL